MKRPATADDVRSVLGAFVSPMIAASMTRSAVDRAGLGAARFERTGPDLATLAELRAGVALFVPEARRDACLERLAALVPSPRAAWSPRPAEEEVPVRDEHGIVDARTRARLLAAELGFEPTAQYKIATAVSELSRNMFRYAGGGVLCLSRIGEPRPGVGIVARDDGPGIADLASVLSGSYRSKTGLGKGLLGCKRIMDDFAVETTPGRGTTVTLRKYL